MTVVPVTSVVVVREVENPTALLALALRCCLSHTHTLAHYWVRYKVHSKPRPSSCELVNPGLESEKGWGRFPYPSPFLLEGLQELAHARHCGGIDELLVGEVQNANGVGDFLHVTLVLPLVVGVWLLRLVWE